MPLTSIPEDNRFFSGWYQPGTDLVQPLLQGASIQFRLLLLALTVSVPLGALALLGGLRRAQ
jgi:hypothetical protein